MNVFVTVLAFTSWDACWNYAHENGLTEEMVVCEEQTYTSLPQPAPSNSTRPRLRPADLMEDKDDS